jgi:hypothetical protein
LPSEVDVAKLFQVDEKENIRVQRRPQLRDLGNLVPDRPAGASGAAPDLYMGDAYGFFNAELASADNQDPYLEGESRALWAADPNSVFYQQRRAELVDEYNAANAPYGGGSRDFSDEALGLRNRFTFNTRFEEFLDKQTTGMDDASAIAYRQKARLIYEREYSQDLSIAFGEARRDAEKNMSDAAIAANLGNLESSLQAAAEADGKVLSTQYEITTLGYALYDGPDDPRIKEDTPEAELNRQYWDYVGLSRSKKDAAYQKVLESMVITRNSLDRTSYSANEANDQYQAIASKYREMQMNYRATSLYDSQLNLMVEKVHQQNLENGMPRISEAAARKIASEKREHSSDRRGP